jgi:hypothetical protein
MFVNQSSGLSIQKTMLTQAAKSEEKQERSNIIGTYNLLSYMSNCQ